MTPIRLLSTDFDGTLIDSPEQMSCTETLCDALKLYKDEGALWIINTGRSLEHLREGLDLLEPPFSPYGAVTNEREIFLCDEADRWKPHEPWNLECVERHRELFSRSRKLFERLENYVAKNPNITIVYGERNPEGVVATSEAAMEAFIPWLHEEARQVEGFAYQQNIIYLRFCHEAYSKGTALEEFGRLLGISREEIFAAGDNYNDLSMLDGQFAAHPACPANAIESVRDTVKKAGGYIASQRAGDGIAEALFYILEKEKAVRTA